MKLSAATTQQDRPIDRADLDALDRGPFIASLVEVLVRSELAADGSLIKRQADWLYCRFDRRMGIREVQYLKPAR